MAHGCAGIVLAQMPRQLLFGHEGDWYQYKLLKMGNRGNEFPQLVPVGSNRAS